MFDLIFCLSLSWILQMWHRIEESCYRIFVHGLIINTINRLWCWCRSTACSRSRRRFRVCEFPRRGWWCCSVCCFATTTTSAPARGGGGGDSDSQVFGKIERLEEFGFFQETVPRRLELFGGQKDRAGGGIDRCRRRRHVFGGRSTRCRSVRSGRSSSRSVVLFIYSLCVKNVKKINTSYFFSSRPVRWPTRRTRTRRPRRRRRRSRPPR